MFSYQATRAAVVTALALLGSYTQAQGVGPRYSCRLDNFTTSCQNFVDTFDDLTLGSSINGYRGWDYLDNFKVASPGNPKHEASIQPHSKPYYARADPETAYFSDEAYYILYNDNYRYNLSSLYFACVKPGTQKAIPCTLTATAPETNYAYHQYHYKPKADKHKHIPLQLAKFDPGFSYLYDVKFAALDANGTLVSLIIDDFKYTGIEFPST